MANKNQAFIINVLKHAGVKYLVSNLVNTLRFRKTHAAILSSPLGLKYSQ